MPRRGGQRHVDRDDVRADEQFVERQLDRRAACALRAAKTAFMPNAGALAATARPMRPRPMIPSCLPRKLDAEHEVERPPLPAAAPHEPIAFGDPPRDGEDQRPRELGGRLGEHVGRVRDDDPARARRGDVDVVVADGDVGDDLQSGAGVEHVGRERIGQRRRSSPCLPASRAQQLVGRRRVGDGPSYETRRRRPTSSSTEHGRRDPAGQQDARDVESVPVRLAVAAVIAGHRGSIRHGPSDSGQAVADSGSRGRRTRPGERPGAGSRRRRADARATASRTIARRRPRSSHGLDPTSP